MKRNIALILCSALAAMFISSCSGGSGRDISDESLPLSDESSAEASEISEEQSKTEIDRVWPYVTGTFIQLWAFTSYNETKWAKHCDYLLEAGIETIIIQWSCDTKANKLSGSYYPSTLDDLKGAGYSASNLVETILKVCEDKGMKVFIGLNNPGEWFQNVFSDWSWCEAEASIGMKVAKDLYDLYKNKYPNAFYGWYFVPEYYNGIGTPDKAAAFLNLYLDGLTEIDASLPLMLSPFLRSFISPEETRDEWTKIFAETRFREGDIFCCQDSVGAGGITLSQLDGYFKALKEATDTEEGLRFWANNEDFTPTGKTAPLDRFVKQMEIASAYVEGYVTFAYSHYFSPDIVGFDIHNAYVNYYNTGEYSSDKNSERAEEYNGAKTLVSQGCAYTGAVNSRGDVWDDDGVKLTDGVIPSADGNTGKYFGADFTNEASITVDLGEITENLSEFDVYDTFGNWGISALESVTYYVSDDEKSWTKVGTAQSYDREPFERQNGWTLFDFKYAPAEPVSGRYVRFDIAVAGAVWIGEICVYTYDE